MRWIISAVMIAYFLFTSGAIFELMQSEATNRIDIPFSYSLSGERTGCVGIYTENDLKCAEWLSRTDKNVMVTADQNGYALLLDYMYCYPRQLFPEDTELREQAVKSGLADKLLKIGPFWSVDLYYPFAGTYTFLTEWNEAHQKTVLAVGVGLREIKPMPSTDNMNLVHQEGNARVYKMK